MANHSLSYEDIVALGGKKEDLKFLENVDPDEASELEFQDDTHNVDDFQMVKEYLESIGLHGKTHKKKSKQKKKVDEDPNGAQEMECSTAKKLLGVTKKTYKRMLVPLDSERTWFEQADSEICTSSPSQIIVDHLTKLGEELMNNEVQLYEKVREKTKGVSEVRWLKGVMSSGTLGDKMASLTLLVQESPVHSLSAINGLLAMASKKGKRECILATETLKDLWLTVLLPENRKLKALQQRPLSMLVEDSMDHHSCSTKLLLWYFEDQIKSKFAKYLSLVQILSHDAVSNIREKMLGCVFDLLYRKPEQEKELLAQLVNKLGDPAKKVASKASFFILKLVDHHVNIKSIVADEVDRLLRRPNIGHKAQYYGVCTLNQFSIPHGEESLAARLVEIYFSFFKGCVTKTDLDGKMLSALLTGVNRAFPFIKGDLPSLEDHLKSLFKIVHVGPLATGIQSLMLLYHVMESQQGVSSRYYQALYSKLLDPRLKHSGKQAMFLNLLFKSVKFDPELGRVKAFLKRILQVCAGHAPPFVCGCLYMLSEVLKVRQNLWAFILQSEYSDEESYLGSSEGTTAKIEAPEGRTEAPEGRTEAPKGRTEAPKGRTEAEISKRDVLTYDPSRRNPLYCRAETSCLWELTRLQAHYHPSVQAFAKKMAAGEYIRYQGDPLLDFTLMRFLDRFVCRNPKQKVSDHGGSLMQRTSALVKAQQKEEAGSASHFTSISKSKVREEELFMYKYFNEKASMEAKLRGKKKKRKKKTGEDSDEDRDRSEEEEDGVEKVSGKDKELDFAGELEMQQISQTKLKQRRQRMQEEEEDDEEEDMSGLEDFSDAEHPLQEAQMERLLLQNLTSSEGEEEEEDGPAKKKSRRGAHVKEDFDPASMFAAAEEFAHLLEEGGATSVEDKYATHHARTPGWPKKRSGKKQANIAQPSTKTNKTANKSVQQNHKKRRVGQRNRH